MRILSYCELQQCDEASIMDLQNLRLYLVTFLMVCGSTICAEASGTKVGSLRRRQQEVVTVEVYIRFDDFAPETGWSIATSDSLENVVDYPVGTYSMGQTELYENVTLLAGQEYIFTIIDGFGDGISNPTTGFFTLKQGNFVLGGNDGEFGFSQSFPFTTILSQTTTVPIAMPTSAPVVAESPASSFSPTASIMVDVVVEIVFDFFASENGWSIANADTNETIVEVPMGTYQSGQENITQIVTLSTGQEYIFTIIDRSGDGICCIEPGSYAIRQDDLVLLDGIGTDFSQSLNVRFKPFFPRDSTTTAPTVPVALPTLGPTPTPTPETSPMPLDAPTSGPVSVAVPTASFTPTASILVDIVVKIVFDSFPLENGWSIRDVVTNDTVVEVPIGTYQFGQDNITQIITVRTGQEYIFTMLDLSGNGMCCMEPGGYAIEQDDLVLLEGIGTDFSSVLNVRFKPFYPREATTAAPTTVMLTPTTLPSAGPAAFPSALPSAISPIQSPVDRPIDDAPVVEVIVDLVLDRFPQETGWSITAMDGTEIVDIPTGTYALPQTKVSQAVFLVADTMYNFTLVDFFSDGVTGGSYAISQGNTELVSGSAETFSSSLTVPFKTLDQSAPQASPIITALPTPLKTSRPSSTSSPVATSLPTAAQIPTAIPTTSSDSVVTNSPSASVTTSAPVLTTTAAPVVTASPISPTIIPTFRPTSAPVPNVGDDGTVDVIFSLIFDGFSEEISWSLTNLANNEVVAASPSTGYSPALGSVNPVYSLEGGASYEFTIRDRAGDGLCCSDGSFRWTQQGVELLSGGGNFGSVATSTFTTVAADQDTPVKKLVPTTLVDSVNATVLIIFDEFPEEIGWSIVESDTGEEVFSVPIGSYPLSTETGTETVELIPETLYNFTIVDSFGDGLTDRGGGGVGSYLVLQDIDGDTLTLVPGDSAFGFNETIQFSPVT